MEKSRAITALHMISTFVLACILVYVGTIAADKYDLPLIHGWALAHGAIFIVFPAYFLLSYFLLMPLLRLIPIQHTTTGSIRNQRIPLLAILSPLIACTGFLIPLAGSLIAIFIGHKVRRRCKAQPELSGAGVALVGLVLGYIGLAYALYIVGVMYWVVATSHGS